MIVCEHENCPPDPATYETIDDYDRVVGHFCEQHAIEEVAHSNGTLRLREMRVFSEDTAR